MCLSSLQVPVYVNKVGPYFNPHETYHYYQLPVCRPDKVCVAGFVSNSPLMYFITVLCLNNTVTYHASFTVKLLLSLFLLKFHQCLLPNL